MNRLLQVFLIALLSGSVWADEYYEFYRLRCAKAIPSLEIEHSGYWNVRDLVWPTWDWQAHIKALKQLEAKEGLYVFDQWYGYSDADSVAFDCGRFQATVAYDVFRREKGPVGSEKPVRMNSRITIKSDRILISALPLRLVTRLKIYTDSNGSEYLDVCTASGCGSDLATSVGTLTTENIGKLIGK